MSAARFSHSVVAVSSVKAVAVRGLDRESGERGADAHPVKRIGDLDRHVRDTRSVRMLHILDDAHDRAVALVDCGDRFVVDVINIGEKGELARRQLALGRKEAPVA